MNQYTIETERLLLRPLTFGEYSKMDGSVTFKAKCYRLELE